MSSSRPKRPRVAIDGPAGAGKSTVARKLAERLGYLLVDTGALYRAVALAAKRAGLAFDDEAEVGALAQTLMQNRQIRVEGTAEGAAIRVFLHDVDVSDEIREPEMSMGASRVSAIPAVREALLEIQRQAGEHGGVVLEGRDIGTVVFPDAEVKFFLTAPAQVRAGRRHVELQQKGSKVSYDETLADVMRRDKQDSERPIAPLRQADDALYLDSSGRSIDEVVEEMVQKVREGGHGE